MKNDPFFSTEIFFGQSQNATGYHPGPVAPPSADGASLEKNLLIGLKDLSNKSTVANMVDFMGQNQDLDSPPKTIFYQWAKIFDEINNLRRLK